MTGFKIILGHRKDKLYREIKLRNKKDELLKDPEEFGDKVEVLVPCLKPELTADEKKNKDILS